MIKPIKGYPGYFVSDDAEIFSNKSGEMKRLATYIGTTAKYEQIDLFQDGKKHKKLVHRLVGEAFIPNPDNKPQINHKDTVKLNNKSWNLEWSTVRENILESYKTMGPVRNFRECSVYKYGLLIGEYKSISLAVRTIAKEYGISQTMIHKHKNYKGFQIVEKGVTTSSKERRADDGLLCEVQNTNEYSSFSDSADLT